MAFPVIDTHTHFGTFGEWDCPLPQLTALMDAYGIDRAVVGDMASNEAGAAAFADSLVAIHGYEDRLRLMLWVNPALPKDALIAAEILARYRDRVACMKIHPLTSGVPLGDARYLPYLELCKRYQLTLASHTGPGELCPVEKLARMAADDPDVNFVAVHMEMRGDHRHAMELVSKHPNLYGDTTFLPLPDIRAAIDRCGKEKLLFGSDAPILNGRYDTALPDIRAMLTPDEAECLFSRNALRLFDRGSV